MIWIVLVLIIIGIAIVNAIQSKPSVVIQPSKSREQTKAERVKVLNRAIDELQVKIENAYVNKIESLKQNKHSTNARLAAAKIKSKKGSIDIVSGYENILLDFKKFVLLNANLAESLRYEEDELLKQQTDWFMLLEYYDSINVLDESAADYIKFGIEPPTGDFAEEAKSAAIRKRIDSRLKTHGLISSHAPDPLAISTDL